MNTIKNQISATPKILGLVMATLLTSPLALAADEGFYAGASIGQSRADLNFNNANISALPPGVSITNSYYDNRDKGYRVFGGYQFNSVFAFEGGRFDLGEFGFSADASPSGYSVGNFEIDGWYLDMVGTIPVTEKLDFLGRAGFNHAFTVARMGGFGAVPGNRPSIRGSDSNVKLGVGLQYALTDNLDLRLEAERYHLDEPVIHKGNVELVSLGVVYRFGAKPVARAPAPTPAPVAPVARATPPPAPAPTPPPPPPEPMRVVFSADSLFDFDKSDIKPAGRQDLDQFIANLNGVTFDVITVIGHTDRIGNRDYNLALSQRRADAVKSYLVQTGRLPPAKITARGVNGANSLLGPNDCTGNMTRAAFVSCLQPDRRVEVEVTATK